MVTRRIRRAARWRAIAGMAAAAGIGCAAVAMELSSSLAGRHDSYYRRLALANYRFEQANDASVAAVEANSRLHQEVAVYDQFNHLLVQPDLRLFRVKPVEGLPAASVVIILSLRLRQAMLSAVGLPLPPSRESYELSETNGAALPIARFDADAGGVAIMVIPFAAVAGTAAELTLAVREP